MRHASTFVTFAVALTVSTAAATAQAQGTRATPVTITAEGTAGYAAFVDDSPVEHAVVGGALRFALTPRLSVGPELTFMRGPGNDRDLLLTGTVTFDLLPARPAAGRVTPYLLAGGGASRYSNGFGVRSFSSWGGAFTGGGGARVWLNDRVYAAGELRLGWEPHYRAAGTVGVRLTR